MIIRLFFISTILLIEVSGKKQKENSDTSSNTVIILTSGGITAKVNHKDSGLVRFPRGETKNDSPISIEVKGPANSEKEGAKKDKNVSGSSTSSFAKGFTPSYGNGIAPFSSLEYLYGNHMIGRPFITSSHFHGHTRQNTGKSDTPETNQNNEDKNLGYYDHHHYHYFRNGQHFLMNLGGRHTLNGEIQDEPPVGDEFHGHGNLHGNNHNHGSDIGHGNHHNNGGDIGHGNHHNNGGDIGHGNNGNHNNNNQGDNGYYYHGHYGPEGVVHFQSGDSPGHGHGHRGYGYTYGNGNGYYYYYGNGDRGTGSGYPYHSNDNSQGNTHGSIDGNLHGPQHLPQEFDFHDQSNFNSHGAFRPPEGVSNNNVQFHGNDQRHSFHGFTNGGRHHSHNFDTGTNGGHPFDRPNSESQFHEPYFRPGHGNDFVQHTGPNFGPHDNRVHFGALSHPSHNPNFSFGNHGHNYENAEHRHNPSYRERYRSDSNTRNNFHGDHPKTEFLLTTRLQNPLIGDMYFSANGDRFQGNNGITAHSTQQHNNDFYPSEQEIDIDRLYRYGEPGVGEHLNQRQYYRPVHISGDYGHRVYYGNNHLGQVGRDSGSGYAKRFGYSAVQSKVVRQS